jgi:hypothetical protein
LQKRIDALERLEGQLQGASGKAAWQ